jgi:hypothetical protein
MKDEKESEELALTIRSKIDALEVTDKDSYALANDYNKQAYDGKKAFHEWFDPIDDASKKQRQAVIAQGKKIDEPFDYIIKTTGSKAAQWMRVEQAKAEAERVKKELEARRIAEEVQIRAAEELAKAGEFKMADKVLEVKMPIQKIEVEEPVKAEGVYYQDRWSAECIDLMELVKSVASGATPIAAIMANETYLNGWARLTKGAEKIPGVKTINTPTQGRRG